VPVGLATKLGLTVTTAGFASALAAFLAGDRSEQTLGAIIGGVIGFGAMIYTMYGRYSQAKELTKADAAKATAGGATATLETLNIHSAHPADSVMLNDIARVAASGLDYRDATPREVPGGGVPMGADPEQINETLGRTA
jgi:hypothetical protein